MFIPCVKDIMLRRIWKVSIYFWGNIWTVLFRLNHLAKRFPYTIVRFFYTICLQNMEWTFLLFIIIVNVHTFSKFCNTINECWVSLDALINSFPLRVMWLWLHSSSCKNKQTHHQKVYTDKSHLPHWDHSAKCLVRYWKILK